MATKQITMATEQITMATEQAVEKLLLQIFM